MAVAWAGILRLGGQEAGIPGAGGAGGAETIVAGDFPLEAPAGDIGFRTFDVSEGAGLAAVVVTMEKTFFSPKAVPSLTVRLGSEDTKSQRVASFKMNEGPLKPLAATTYVVRDGSLDSKRDSLGMGIPLERAFDVTFAWQGKRLEIRVDGQPRYRGEIEFVPTFLHIQVQSGRAVFRSVSFGPARFVEGPLTRSKPVRAGK